MLQRSLVLTLSNATFCLTLAGKFSIQSPTSSNLPRVLGRPKAIFHNPQAPDIHFGSQDQMNSLSKNTFKNIKKKIGTQSLHVNLDIQCSEKISGKKHFCVPYKKRQIYV
jgi:hypothetical protein